MTERSKNPQTHSWPPAVIVLVTDIGGSVALHEILVELPGGFPIPLLVLQPAETVLIEANLNALERTVPFGVQMIDVKADLRPGNVYVGLAECVYRLDRDIDSMVIVAETAPDSKWPTGDSLRRLGNELGEQLLVAFLSVRTDGFNLEQLSLDLASDGVTLAVVQSAAGPEATSTASSTNPKFKIVRDVAELSSFIIQKSKSPTEIRRTNQFSRVSGE